MKIQLSEISIREITTGYTNDNQEGVVGYFGKLNIRPKYQREFVYKGAQQKAVIETVQKDFPLNVMYWVKNPDGTFTVPELPPEGKFTKITNELGTYEVLDGQQRTISICEYVAGSFSYNGMYFHSLTDVEQNQILDYKLMVYFCEGNDKEKLDWFRTINIAGEKLYDQELRNAIYTGTWLTDAKRYFSKIGCAAYGLGSDYMNGHLNRQDYLEKVIGWIAKDDSNEGINNYMSKHQHDENATELWEYFKAVINWVQSVFIDTESEMKGLEWGRLYETYHNTNYNQNEISSKLLKLDADPYINNLKGVYEYILGGEMDTKLLEVRLFDEATKKSKYFIQTQAAEENETSNCPLCTIGHDSNKTRIYRFDEMDADHVKAWSNGGTTNSDNCEMLCKTHNRAKGNK
jgi:uncharacterized protein with ParB-like and HNH nuclease domain